MPDSTVNQVFFCIVQKATVWEAVCGGGDGCYAVFVATKICSVILGRIGNNARKFSIK